MFTKKQISVVLILLALLAGGVCLYKERFQHWPWQKGAVVPASGLITENKDSSPRVLAMNYVAAHIGDISPENPVLGGNWQVTRFWFVSDSDQDVYAEYEDGHIMRRVLLKTEVSGKEIYWERKAFFEPGESDWNLKTGQDSQFGKSLDLYINQGGEWVKMTK